MSSLLLSGHQSIFKFSEKAFLKEVRLSVTEKVLIVLFVSHTCQYDLLHIHEPI